MSIGSSLRHVFRLAAGVALATLLASGPLAGLLPVAADGQSEGPLLPGRAQLTLKNERVSFRDQSTSAIEDPFLRNLSGPGWRLGLGMDPRINGAQEFSPLNRRSIQSSPASGSLSPALQAGGVSVPYRDPAPAFSRNLLITRDYSSSPIQLEPHMAVDPKDPDHIVVGVIDYNFPGVSVYVTFDGGVTWQGPIQTRYVREDLIAGGDPVLAFDRQGNVYLIFISIGLQDFLVGRFAATAQTSTIAITQSKDGGLTWGEPVATARRLPFTELEPAGPDQRVRGQIKIPFLDKPWLSVGPDPKNAAQDVIHISFTEFMDVLTVLYIDELPVFAAAEMQTTIRTVRSTDLGRTWSDTISVSPTVVRASAEGPSPGATIEEGGLRVVQGSEPHVAPDGTVYVSWMDSTDDDSQRGLGEVYVARSDDAGKSYGRPVRAAVFNEPGFRPRTAFFRYWGTAFPKVAIGTQGEVYLLYGALNTTKPLDDGDIFFVRSTDKGASWTRPKRLSGDDGTSLQFYPAIAVDPDGVLHVMYGDMRNDPKQTAYHIYYSTSTDKGDTWGFTDPKQNLHTDDTRVTDFPSNPNRGFPNGLFIGDYFAIAASKSEVYMVWADTRLGEFGGFNQKVAFARKRSIPNPEVFISPPSGPGGQQITVQGFNLQPGIQAYITIGGVVVSTERTNADGRFTASLFVPVTGEGAQDVRIIDDSGNIAGSSYYTDFGFGSIRDSTKRIQTQLQTISGGAPPTGGAAPGKRSAASWWMVGAAAAAGLGIGTVAALALRPRRPTPPLA